MTKQRSTIDKHRMKLVAVLPQWAREAYEDAVNELSERGAKKVSDVAKLFVAERLHAEPEMSHEALLAGARATVLKPRPRKQTDPDQLDWTA